VLTAQSARVTLYVKYHFTIPHTTTISWPSATWRVCLWTERIQEGWKAELAWLPQQWRTTATH